MVSRRTTHPTTPRGPTTTAADPVVPDPLSALTAWWRRFDTLPNATFTRLGERDPSHWWAGRGDGAMGMVRGTFPTDDGPRPWCAVLERTPDRPAALQWALCWQTPTGALWARAAVAPVTLDTAVADWAEGTLPRYGAFDSFSSAPAFTGVPHALRHCFDLALAGPSAHAVHAQRVLISGWVEYSSAQRVESAVIGALLNPETFGFDAAGETLMTQWGTGDPPPTPSEDTLLVTTDVLDLVGTYLPRAIFESPRELPGLVVRPRGGIAVSADAGTGAGLADRPTPRPALYTMPQRAQAILLRDPSQWVDWDTHHLDGAADPATLALLRAACAQMARALEAPDAVLRVRAWATACLRDLTYRHALAGHAQAGRLARTQIILSARPDLVQCLLAHLLTSPVAPARELGLATAGLFTADPVHEAGRDAAIPGRERRG